MLTFKIVILALLILVFSIKIEFKKGIDFKAGFYIFIFTKMAPLILIVILAIDIMKSLK